ncbi:imidazoleglycerol-phosphate dehydratase [Rhodovulum sulfidophilum]|uniref:DUF2147 domain-containing protein n=1 Tax=Rhodovulum visakhapatnamense TaxID=364297 RepID=A0ABS1RGE5_9RHOB|nr:DUF2147 domain-containing protein [Rhodovulum visakhapatnamense]MBL3569975.1 DUF2147 domain-containing protein [Rhodovulum visakhapatnamense]MBL3578721.1 DUF2147 domain-containing protein [Rhodovulum visakhapatnamense]OLS43430.1 imidazoleglycerol-phosphate dehydratase [Rhodovulum sulfidophilum]
MRITVLIAALTLAATAAHADPVEGVWQTPLDDNGNFGHIRISPCGAALCGTLIRAYDGTGHQIDSDNVGKQIVWDMKPQGDGRYGQGKVWAPDRDKTYNSKMALEGEFLSVSGCVIGICRDGGRWKRVQ